MIYTKVALSSIPNQCFPPLPLNDHIWVVVDCRFSNRQSIGAKTHKRREQIIFPVSWKKLIVKSGLSWALIGLIMFVYELQSTSEFGLTGYAI